MGINRAETPFTDEQTASLMRTKGVGRIFVTRRSPTMSPRLHVTWNDLETFGNCPCLDLLEHMRGACGRVTEQGGRPLTPQAEFERAAWDAWRFQYTCEQRIDRLETELERLVEALQFYAAGETDDGEKARVALG